MKHVLTFPTPEEGEEPFTEFVYAIDGNRFAIPKFSEVVKSMGVDRRLLKQGLADDIGARILTSLQVAHHDDERALGLFDYLSKEQQGELFKRWGDFTGADLPESSGPSNA
jgi:hypothetical protein